MGTSNLKLSRIWENGDIVTSELNGSYQGTAIFDYDDNGEAWFHIAINKDMNVVKYGYLGYVDYLRRATKKERKILFEKIREAGYEWDIEKREIILKEKFNIIINGIG